MSARFESIQPVVLVGGRSRRFGRDKLREPWRGSEGGEWLVDQPRLVLQGVFAREPWAAGACAPPVAARFARMILDPAPGSGPAGGIVASLEAAGGPIFALAGDLPLIDRDTVRRIVDAASTATDADAALGTTDRLEPCIGLYRPSAIASLRAALGGPLDHAGEVRVPSLHRLLEQARVIRVPIESARARNLNAPDDLAVMRATLRPHRQGDQTP